MFLSSHELDEVQRVADRVAIIRAGPARRHRHRRAAAPAGAADDRAAVRRRRSPPAVFESLDGVQQVTADGDRVTLQRPGELAPLLRVIADHDPVDVVARHADLDELFLTYYREDRGGDAD